jgi:uncharacterized protein Usg
MVSKAFIRQLEGYGLTTATILYRMPDHPALLQTYIWQEYDLAPNFPVLLKFLDFWKRELDGPLHSVTVAHSRLIKPAEFQTRRRHPHASLNSTGARRGCDLGPERRLG